PRGISGWFSKDRRGKKDDPILLERVEKYWSPSGWNEAGFREEFRSTVYSALASDLGKVETFCTADIRRYQVDPNFKLMFQSATGIRQMLSSDERIQKWDEEIAKETRTFQEKFIFLFEDLFGGHVWAMILAMILI